MLLQGWQEGKKPINYVWVCQSCNAAAVVERAWYHGDSVGATTQVE